MLLTSIPGALGVALLLVTPGLVWAWRCYPSADPVTRLAVGFAIGIALQMHLAAVLSAGPGITAASEALATGAALVVAALLAWRMPYPRAPRLKLSGGAWRQGAQLAGVLAIMEGVRLIPLALQQVPRGWDPSFHSLLASTTVATGRLPTWAPFEPIPSNYPYGPHVLMAQISLLSGLGPDVAFAALLDALVPIMTGLALYAFARRALRGHALALAAVAAFSLLGFRGSIDYGWWGGLPNALGIFLLFAFLTVLFAPGFELTRVIVGGILLGAIPLAHHHVMLTTVLLLLPYAVYLVWRWLARRGGVAGRRATWRAIVRLALTGGVALLTVGYYVIPFAARARELPDTTILRYYDHFSGWLLAENGWVLWVLALAGAPLLDPRVRRAAMGAMGRARAFVTIASAGLLVDFLLFYYVYRTYSLHRYNQPYTAFTPSRFLADLTPFLAIYAAQPLVALWRLGSRAAWKTGRLAASRLARGGLNTVTRGAVRVGVVLMFAISAYIALAPQLVLDDGRFSPGETEAFAWIRTHTSANTFVFNLDPMARWAPYFTQREVAVTPVPTSEFTVGYVDEKQYLSRILLDVMAHSDAGPLVASASSGSALPALLNRPAVILTNQDIPGLNASAAFSAGAERVYPLQNPFAQLLAAPDAPATGTAQWWPSLTSAPPGGWDILDTPADGWTNVAPSGGGQNATLYVRVVLPAALHVGAQLTCNAEDGATLYVDGQQVSGACDGALRPAPSELFAAGPHVLAARARPGQHLGPWFDLFVTGGLAS